MYTQGPGGDNLKGPGPRPLSAVMGKIRRSFLVFVSSGSSASPALFQWCAVIFLPQVAICYTVCPAAFLRGTRAETTRVDSFRVLTASTGQTVRLGLVLESRGHGISTNAGLQTEGQAQHFSPVLSPAPHLLVCMRVHARARVERDCDYDYLASSPVEEADPSLFIFGLESAFSLQG